MNFTSFEAFVAMGGHAGYVWSAYGLGALVLAWNLLAPWLQRRRLGAAEARRARREARPEEARP